ncbi:MAG: SemiSWEET transporter [Chloroflexi bacterium]|nr:SemiSWEET transporter [Chloroflexota bacterium]
MPEYLGYIGGVLTTCCYVPQIIRVFRMKSAREISLLFTLMLLVGVVVWLSYGILLSLGPVILWNAIALVIIAVLLYAKLKYGR